MLFLDFLDLFDRFVSQLECARVVSVDDLIFQSIVKHQVEQGLDLVLHGCAGVLVFPSDSGNTLVHAAFHMAGTDIHHSHIVDSRTILPS